MFQEYLTEFLGTMFLMLIILTTGNYLAIGVALAICVYLAQHISKQAFNPAVAIALMHHGALPVSALMPYIIAEIGGALVAVYTLRLIR